MTQKIKIFLTKIALKKQNGFCIGLTGYLRFQILFY